MATVDDEFGLTDEDKAILTTEAARVQGEAKRKFKLSDRLHGITYAKAKIVLFTDLDAATEYASVAGDVDRLVAILRSVEDPEVRAALQGDLDELEAVVGPKRQAMLDGALAVHMRAVPQVVIDRANRKARTAYALGDGTIPEDVREHYFEMQNQIVLGHVIQRIVDAHGNEAEFDRETVAQELNDSLPAPQFQRLLNAFNALVFNDQLAQQATADPGF